jgi:hypothetical protein
MISPFRDEAKNRAGTLWGNEPEIPLVSQPATRDDGTEIHRLSGPSSTGFPQFFHSLFNRLSPLRAQGGEATGRHFLTASA